MHVVRRECLVAAHISRHAQVVEWHENRIGTDEAEPEVNPAQGFVHHAAKHLREPEVGSGKNPEHRRHTHDHVEVPHHKVSRVQHDVGRRLRQEEAAHPSGDEHRDKPQREERGRIDAQLCPVKTSQPDQHDNRGGNGDDQSGKRECQRRNRIHPTHEHVMPINHVTKDSQSAEGVDQHSVAEHRLAHVGNQNMRDNAHPRHDRDIDLRMSEKPEEVLP